MNEDSVLREIFKRASYTPGYTTEIAIISGVKWAISIHKNGNIFYFYASHQVDCFGYQSINIHRSVTILPTEFDSADVSSISIILIRMNDEIMSDIVISCLESIGAVPALSIEVLSL